MFDEIWPVVVVSLKVALCSTLLAVTSAVMLGQVFAAGRSKLMKALEIMVYLPLALPPVALGFGLLIIFGHNGIVGSLLHRFGIDVAFSFLGAVLASFAVSLGIGVRTMKTAFLGIDLQQRQVAMLMGARSWQIFLFIILPQCKGALLTTIILSFIRALSEFGATMVLAGNVLGSTRTLALAIWVDMETPGKEGECYLLVFIAMIIAVIAIVLSEIVIKKWEMK